MNLGVGDTNIVYNVSFISYMSVLCMLYLQESIFTKGKQLNCFYVILVLQASQ